MERVKWGVLGTANIASWGTIPGMKKAESVELYAIAGRDIKKAERFKNEFGFAKAYGSYDELLEDPHVQAVYIPLPNSLHLEWVKKALNARKHVLCEKPIALNAMEAVEMFKTAEKNKVHLMEAYAYLHSPYIKSLKDDIASGVIGEVDYIDTAFVTQGYKEDIRLHRELGGGAMYDLGCYCTSMILSLVEATPTFVRAEADFSDDGIDLMTSGLIRFDNGVRATFDVGMVLGQNSDSRYDRLFIHGSKGYIRSDVEYNKAGTVSYRIYTKYGFEERTLQIPNNYSLEIEQLSQCILYGDTPEISPEFSIMNSVLMEKILDKMGYFYFDDDEGSENGVEFLNIDEKKLKEQAEQKEKERIKNSPLTGAHQEIKISEDMEKALEALEEKISDKIEEIEEQISEKKEENPFEEIPLEDDDSDYDESIDDITEVLTADKRKN